MRFYETLTLQKWEKRASGNVSSLLLDLNTRHEDGWTERVSSSQLSETLALCEIMTPLLLQIGGTRDTISATADGLHFEKDECTVRSEWRQSGA